MNICKLQFMSHIIYDVELIAGDLRVILEITYIQER